MIFIINGLKWDTEKMEVISIVKKNYMITGLAGRILAQSAGKEHVYETKDCTLWRSNKNRWLLTHEGNYGIMNGEAIKEQEAKELLKRYNYKKYEELYGEIPEA